MPDETLEAFFTRLAAEAGTPSLGSDEARHVLDLTRVVAHRVERRYAPLTAYVAGLALGAEGAGPEQRAARIRDLTAVIERLAE